METSASADIQMRYRESFKKLSIDLVREICEQSCTQKRNKGAGDKGKGKGQGKGKKKKR